MGIRFAVATLASAGLLGVAGCVTDGPDAYRNCVNAALIGGLIGAAVDEENRERGAAVGAAVFGVGCSVYRYMNERQVEQMAAGTTDFLRAAPRDRSVRTNFRVDGGTVAVEAGQPQRAAGLLSQDLLASAGIPEGRYCRPVSREVTLDSGTRLDGQHVECVNEAGDWEPATRADFGVAST